MPATLDLTGLRFGRLQACRFVGWNRFNQRLWLCKCACGNESTVSVNTLRRGRTQSCGCLRRERLQTANITHGMTRSRTWTIWVGMRGRCRRPMSNWKYYGGKGITVCDRWAKFENFLEDMGEAPPGHTIERKDVSKGYEPENCCWATQAEQSRNTSRNVFLSYQGETRVVADWATILGLSAPTLYRRVREGWSAERALTTPVKEAKRGG